MSARRAGPFTSYFRFEHGALGRLLRRCRSPSGEVDLQVFDRFRRRMLQRVAVEERVLLPALLATRGQAPLYQPALTKDHGGLVASCAPAPEGEWVDRLWEQLELHHSVEMADDGFCAQLEASLGAEAEAVLRRAAALPPIDLGGGLGFRARLAALLAATGVLNAPKYIGSHAIRGVKNP